MGETLLATSGDTIKLWDAATYTFYQEVPTESGHVNRLVWNQDGQCLASLGDSGKEIFLSAICGKSAANIGVVRGIESPTCLNFACRSPHYLGVGNASGTVTIWNVKSQSKKKVFAPTDRSITRIAFSHSDSHIAASTKKGTLYMLSVVNSVTAGPYHLFNDQQVLTDLAYSRVKKSLLGCCSEGGVVAMYDTHANKVVHSFPSAHSSPVAAVSFSPVNELLMVSVGYDKKLCCFNVQTRQPVMTHRSSAPLTSITFLGMGQLVALGTMTGQVFIHDMRTIRSPLATLRAHRTAVTNVLLQPCPKSKSVSSSKTGQRNNTATTLSAPSQRPLKSCSDQPTELSPDMRPNPKSSPDINDLSVFSPVRDTNLPPQIQTCEASGLDDLTSFKTNIPMASDVTSSIFSPVRSTDIQHKHYTPWSPHVVDINEDNLLSPIRDTTLIERNDSVNSESPASQVMLPSTVEIMVSSPADVTDKENIEPSPVVTKDHTSTFQQMDYKSTFNPSITDALQREELPKSSFPQEGGVHHQGLPLVNISLEHPTTPKMNPSTRCETSNSPDPTKRLTLPADNNSCTVKEGSKGTNSSIYSYPAMVTSPASQVTMSLSSPSKLSPPKKRQLLRPLQASDLAPKTPPTEPENTTTAAAAATTTTSDMPASHGVPQLQMELVRSCMVDVLEEFQDEMNSRLVHLQYIITKKFIQQQEVMEQLHRQYSLNEDLMKEVEVLRQQVARLEARY